MRNLPLIVAVLLGLSLGCSGGSSSSSSLAPPPPPPVVSVTVTPVNASIPVNATQQFTASVTGTSNTGVTWSVSGAGCSGATCGTFSSTTSNPVSYTAPAGVPNPAAVNVTATSQADPLKSASAAVTITPPPVTVSVAPDTATVVVGGTLEFTATVTGTANAAVTWSLTGPGCAVAACGTLSSTTSNPVTYAAPATAPNPATLTLTATSQADASKSAAAAITVATSNNFKLKGQYAFLFTGFDADGPMAAAGTFVADGDGNLTSGIEDVTRSSGVTKELAFTGTYSVGSDLRGSLMLTSARGVSTYRFALQPNGDARFIEFDATGTRGAGVIEKQNPAAFSTAAISGDFALAVAGNFLGGTRLGLAGRFRADGAGTFVNGVCDVSIPGTSYSSLPLSGTYTVGANGRGTAVLQALVPATSGVFNFSFYVISSGEIFLVSTDSVTVLAPLFSGMVVQQSGGPFTTTSLRGVNIFHLTGLVSTAASSNTAVGQITADGGGNLVGVFDQNARNVVLENVAFTGTYDVSPNGRGTLGFVISASSRSHALYMIRENRAFILEGIAAAPGTDVSMGLVEAQAAGPFDKTSLAGAYTLGTHAPVTASVPDLGGTVVADGSGNASGTVDESAPSGLSPDQAFSATHTIAANGRGAMSASLPSGSLTNLVLWIVSPSRVVMISGNASRAHNAVLTLEK